MTNTSLNQEEGYIVNLGARWVTLGASLVYSYRDVTDNNAKDANNNALKRTAHSVSAGMMYKNFVLNAEALNIAKEYTKGLENAGTITTFEVRYKLWREFYLESVFEFSNIAAGFGPGVQQMGKGDATQTTIGFRFFPVAGVDLSMHYRQTTDTPKDKTAEKFDETEGLIQAHLYF